MKLKEWSESQGIARMSAVRREYAAVMKPHLLREVKGDWILVMTVPYRTGDGESIVASFASVPDYHVFFQSFFLAFQTRLRQAYPEAEIKGFSDHSPFDEVSLAAGAALGVRGDNGLLIDPEYGSYVVIGEMVVTLSKDELIREGFRIAGEPSEKSCLHCGKCAEACPARCAGTKDRSGCVSALSQKKGELTREEADRLRLSPWIWGCDTCQRVCPMNRGRAFSSVPYFRSSSLEGMSGEDILGLSEEEYVKYSFSWRPRSVMARNMEEKEKENG